MQGVGVLRIAGDFRRKGLRGGVNGRPSAGEVAQGLQPGIDSGGGTWPQQRPDALDAEPLLPALPGAHGEEAGAGRRGGRIKRAGGRSQAGQGVHRRLFGGSEGFGFLHLCADMGDALRRQAALGPAQQALDGLRRGIDGGNGQGLLEQGGQAARFLLDLFALGQVFIELVPFALGRGGPVGKRFPVEPVNREGFGAPLQEQCFKRGQALGGRLRHCGACRGQDGCDCPFDGGGKIGGRGDGRFEGRQERPGLLDGGGGKPDPVPIIVIGLELGIKRRRRAAQLFQVRDFENLLEVSGAVLRPGRKQIAERMLSQDRRGERRLREHDAECGEITFLRVLAVDPQC